MQRSAWQLLAGSAIAIAFASSTFAQQASGGIENLKQMKISGGDGKMETVAQTGQNADLLRENLKKVKLPAGFRIDLYAVVPDARSIAVAPSTNMMFVGTRKSTVWAVTNRNSGPMATEVKEFAPPVKFKNPNAVCWTKDGVLVVVASNRV